MFSSIDGLCWRAIPTPSIFSSIEISLSNFLCVACYYRTMRDYSCSICVCIFSIVRVLLALVTLAPDGLLSRLGTILRLVWLFRADGSAIANGAPNFETEWSSSGIPSHSSWRLFLATSCSDCSLNSSSKPSNSYSFSLPFNIIGDTDDHPFVTIINRVYFSLESFSSKALHQIHLWIMIFEEGIKS